MILKRRIRYIRSGNAVIKRLMVLLALILLTGCLPSEWMEKQFPSRDWYLDLKDDYRLNRLNKYDIWIEKKLEKYRGIILIDEYSITSYAIGEETIYLKGISTENKKPSEIDRENGEPVYYLIQTSNEMICGPFSSETELKNFCHINRIPETINWVLVTDPPEMGAYY